MYISFRCHGGEHAVCVIELSPTEVGRTYVGEYLVHVGGSPKLARDVLTTVTSEIGTADNSFPNTTSNTNKPKDIHQQDAFSPSHRVRRPADVEPYQHSRRPDRQ